MDLLRKQIASVKKYSGSLFYIDFNKKLRQNAIPQNTEDLIVYVNLWFYLDSNRLYNSTRVYRGIVIDDEKKQTFEESLQTLNSAFISTSENKKIADEFQRNNKCCVLFIDLPEGSRAFNISQYSDFPKEQEILLAPGFIRLKEDMGNGRYLCEYENFRSNFIINNIYLKTIEKANCEECKDKGIKKSAVIFSDGQNYCNDCFMYYNKSVDGNVMYFYFKDKVREETTLEPEVYKFSRNSKKASRKSRKASCKSRKASCKSRKVSRKSRKASRKSRKASCKSRKASRK
jgi:hypothetical protein